MMEPTDRELVQRCLDGHADDFRFLVRRYEKPLFAFLVSRLGNPALAREAAQESLVRAFFALPHLHKPEAFHCWLIGIAARVALETRRVAHREAGNPEAIADSPAPAPAAPVDHGLDEAIAALPDAQRELVLLRYYEELSCQEIADRLAIPLGTVTKTLSRAYAALREHLQERGPAGMEA